MQELVETFARTHTEHASAQIKEKKGEVELLPCEAAGHQLLAPLLLLPDHLPRCAVPPHEHRPQAPHEPDLRWERLRTSGMATARTLVPAREEREGEGGHRWKSHEDYSYRRGLGAVLGKSRWGKGYHGAVSCGRLDPFDGILAVGCRTASATRKKKTQHSFRGLVHVSF